MTLADLLAGGCRHRLNKTYCCTGTHKVCVQYLAEYMAVTQREASTSYALKLALQILPLQFYMFSLAPLGRRTRARA